MQHNLSKENTLLLVIDIQEKFRNVILEFDRVINNTKKLIRVCNILNIPIIVTEQYPKGLGKTVKEIQDNLDKFDFIEKTAFDCFNDNSFMELMNKKFKNIKNIIVCGIEAHVCVFQTALSALNNSRIVHLAADATSSRKKSDYEIALQRLQQEGIKLTSTEIILFQLIKDSKDKNFKKISEIVKS